MMCCVLQAVFQFESSFFLSIDFQTGGIKREEEEAIYEIKHNLIL
jgi:hypothetical protein